MDEIKALIKKLADKVQSDDEIKELFKKEPVKAVEKILGVDPLKITMLKCGTFAAYKRKFGNTIRRMNPESCEINDLLTCHQFDSLERRGIVDDWI